MKVKQIEPCDVIAHLTAGKEVSVVNYGEKNYVSSVRVFDLRECSFTCVVDCIRTKGNLFFERIQEDK